MVTRRRWTEAVPDPRHHRPTAPARLETWTRACRRVAVLSSTVLLAVSITTFTWLGDLSKAAWSSPPRAVSTPIATPAVDLARLLREADSLAAATSSRPQAPPAPDYRPVNGRVTSGVASGRLHPVTFQVRPHRGVDIAAPWGSPIHAPADGIVSSVGDHPTYGKMVSVLHHDGIATRYAHASMVLVRTGQPVRRGDILALVGDSGLTTGPHVHYEVMLRGRHLDPLCFTWMGPPLDNPAVSSSERQRTQSCVPVYP